MTKNIFLLLLLSIAIGCDDSSTLGTDVLDGEKQDVLFTENFSFEGDVIIGDSLKTYNSDINSSTYMLGHINEEIFGSSKADIYGRFLFNSNLTKPDFSRTDSITLDSVVFTFVYDTTGFYGDPSVFHDIEIYELLDDISERDSIWSNETFNISSDVLGSRSMVPRPNDSLKIWDFSNDTMQTARPHLRIKMDDFKAKDLVDRLNVESEGLELNDSLLNDRLKGFHIRSNVSSENSIFALDFGLDANLSSGFNALNIYYTELEESGESISKAYSLLYSTITSNHFEQDHSGSLVGSGFVDNMLFDSLMFVQSLEGLKSVFRIGVDQFVTLQDKLINYAELLVYIAELDEDNTLLYPPIPFVFTTKYEDDGSLVFSDDVQNSNSEFGNIISGFGGDIKTANGIDFYKCNVTSYLKERIKTGEPFELVLESAGKNETAKRTVIYGAKHSQYAPQLKVTYTNVN